MLWRLRAARPAAEVPRCARGAIEAELGRILALRILDAVCEPAAPVEAARAATRHADDGIRQTVSGFELVWVIPSHPLRMRRGSPGGPGLSDDFLPAVGLVRTPSGGRTCPANRALSALRVSTSNERSSSCSSPKPCEDTLGSYGQATERLTRRARRRRGLCVPRTQRRTRGVQTARLSRPSTPRPRNWKRFGRKPPSGRRRL